MDLSKNTAKETISKREVSDKPHRRSIDPYLDGDTLKVKGFDEANYFGYWFSDTGDAIQQAWDMGYDFVNPQGQILSDGTVEHMRSNQSSVISKRAGQGVTIYFMAIPRELYNKRQEEKAKKRKEMEEQIKNPGLSGSYGKIDVSYR